MRQSFSNASAACGEEVWPAVKTTLQWVAVNDSALSSAGVLSWPGDMKRLRSERAIWIHVAYERPSRGSPSPFALRYAPIQAEAQVFTNINRKWASAGYGTASGGGRDRSLGQPKGAALAQCYTTIRKWTLDFLHQTTLSFSL